MIRIEDFDKFRKANPEPPSQCSAFVLAENNSANRDLICRLPNGHRGDHEDGDNHNWLNRGGRRVR